MDLDQLGELLADLPPMTATETGLTALPPSGAGKFVSKNDTAFKWEPLSSEAWRALLPRERAQIVIDRGIAWLEENADSATVPFAFVDSTTSDGGEQIFSETASTLREAICAAHGLVLRNPGRARVVLIGLSAAIFLATGLHPFGTSVGTTASQLSEALPPFGPHLAEALIAAYAKKFCHED